MAEVTVMVCDGRPTDRETIFHMNMPADMISRRMGPVITHRFQTEFPGRELPNYILMWYGYDNEPPLLSPDRVWKKKRAVPGRPDFMYLSHTWMITSQFVFVSPADAVSLLVEASINDMHAERFPAEAALDLLRKGILQWMEETPEAPASLSVFDVLTGNAWERRPELAGLDRYLRMQGLLLKNCQRVSAAVVANGSVELPSVTLSEDMEAAYEAAERDEQNNRAQGSGPSA